MKSKKSTHHEPNEALSTGDVSQVHMPPMGAEENPRATLPDVSAMSLEEINLFLDALKTERAQRLEQARIPLPARGERVKLVGGPKRHLGKTAVVENVYRANLTVRLEGEEGKSTNSLYLGPRDIERMGE